MKEIKFYKSPTGKILAGLVEAENVECLAEIKAGSVDDALEKHVPVVKKENGKIIVEVGSVTHPMLDNHWIQFIALQSEERGLEVVTLNPGEVPHAEFAEVKGGIVFEYCNLHGLWKAEF